MATSGTSDGEIAWEQPARPKKDKRYNVLVALDDEQMAAAEGWRSAHGISNQAEALGELIRLGLLSEIAKIYRLVADNRSPAATRSGLAKRKPGHKPQPS